MPYDQHPDLLTPIEDTVLWRYMDFARFLYLLEMKCLWFARADQFGDPLESMLTDAEIQEFEREVILNSVSTRGKQPWLLSSELMRSTAYFSCWRAKPNESLAMWDLYGKGNGIIGIKSTVGQLKRAVKVHPEAVYITLVEYIDWSQRGRYHNTLVRSARKDLSYEHEAELRAIIWPSKLATEHQRAIQQGQQPPETPLGISVPIEPGALIREVVVGPREQPWVYELVDRVMKRYALNVLLSRSDRLTKR